MVLAKGSLQSSVGTEKQNYSKKNNNNDYMAHNRTQRGRVVKAPDSAPDSVKSRSDHLAGVFSWWTLVQMNFFGKFRKWKS